MRVSSRALVLTALALPLAGCGESSEPAPGEAASPDSGPSSPSMNGTGGSAGAADSDPGGPRRPLPDAGGAAFSDAGDSGSAHAPCLDFTAPVPFTTLAEPELDQLSGLVASRSQPGVLFAHEDSTGASVVYALDATSGRTLAAITLVGAPSTDWEDIAVGPGPDGTGSLFIGDIGDNPVRTGGTPRGEIQVIRLPEPVVSLSGSGLAQSLSAFDVLRFTYPGGVHESETLLVHPVSGELVIVTRSAAGDSRIFRAARDTPPDTPTPLEEIGRLALPASGQGALATAGDISPSGDRILVRSYTDVYLWPAPLGMALPAVFAQAPNVMAWAAEPQGEAISFTADGRAWLSAGEQERIVYRAAEDCP